MATMISFPQTSEFAIRRTETRPHRLAISGVVDLMTSVRFEEALQQELEEHGEAIVDLSAVTYIDSCGIKVVVAAMKQADRNGWSLWIDREMPDPVREVFACAGLEP